MRVPARRGEADPTSNAACRLLQQASNMMSTQRDGRVSDADNGQRLSAILARLRAVAASASAQQGRYPAGELTASTAQLDTLTVATFFRRAA
eukprot:scaffold11571_cov119-Isochrysis_galbana.AAC.13